MDRFRRVQNPTAVGNFTRMVAYTLLLFLVQALWISRGDWSGIRIDLLLPLMFAVALKQSPLVSISWAFIWGYVVDVLSGKFWGFHVVSYVVTACLVNIGAQKVEFHNPFHQVAFLGLCSLGQSAILGLFLWAEPASSYLLSTSMWRSLGIRSAVMTALSPLIIYLIKDNKKVTAS